MSVWTVEVTAERIVSQTFEVEADTRDEAEHLGLEQAKNCSSIDWEDQNDITNHQVGSVTEVE